VVGQAEVRGARLHLAAVLAPAVLGVAVLAVAAVPSMARAGEIYVNGVKADVLPVMTMQNVNVRFDERGNVYIDAPMYRVSVVSGGASGTVSSSAGSSPATSSYTPPASSSHSAPAPSYSAPAPSYSASAPSYSASAPSYSASAPSYSASAPSYSAPAPSYSAPAPSYSAPTASNSASGFSAPAPSYSSAPAPSYSAPAPGYDAPVYTATAPLGVSPGTWWLVTEDNDSAGQAVDVKVNGNVVKRVRSGEGQVIVDIGAFLRHGSNDVELVALPGSYGGGSFIVYIGRGSDSGGTVQINTPDIRWQRRSTDSGSGTTKEFTLAVP
jgi:hypothetical protein